MRPHHRQLFVSFMIVVFVAAASLALAIAFGFRLDQGRLVRTGTLVVSVNPTSADVFIDGRLVRTRTPSTIRALVPGPHRIRVQDEGFAAWEKILTINASKTTYVVGTVLARELHPVVTTVSVPARQVIASPNQKQLAVVGPSGEVSIVNQHGSVIAEIATPPLKELWSWSPYGRFLAGRTDTEVVVIETSRPYTVQRFPLPATPSRWVWNQQTETLGYVLGTDRQVTAYDLLTHNHQVLPFRTNDLVATGQVMWTIESTNLEQTAWQLVTRQGPRWEALRRQTLNQPVERFLGQRSDRLLLGQTSGLIVWAPDSAIQQVFTDTPRGATWSSHGQLLVWTDSELWVFDNDQLHNPQLLGRFGTVPGPTHWLPHGDAFLRVDGASLVMEEIDVRGNRYRHTIFANGEAGASWSVDDTEVIGAAIVEGRLVLSRITALPRVGGGR